MTNFNIIATQKHHDADKKSSYILQPKRSHICQPQFQATLPKNKRMDSESLEILAVNDGRQFSQVLHRQMTINEPNVYLTTITGSKLYCTGRSVVSIFHPGVYIYIYRSPTE